MGNRKDKPWYFRLLGSVSAFVLLGAVIYVVFAGFNMYSTSILLAGLTGVAVPGVVLGDTFLEMVLGAFETFLMASWKCWVVLLKPFHRYLVEL